jgi:fucose permease
LSFTIDYGTSRGLGRQDVDIPQAWRPSLLASEYAFTILYNPALMVTKTSILAFYIRISKKTQKFLYIGSYVTLAVVNVAGFILTFINAFQCRPPRAAYDLSIKSQSCMSILTIYLASVPINVGTDLAILILPLPILTGMRLPRRQKMILVFLFALGVFVIIVGVVRIYYLQLVANSSDTQGGVNITSSLGFSYNASLAFLWSAVEVNVGIICACIPIVKPLIKLLWPRLLLDHNDTSNEESPSHPQEPSSGGKENHQPPRPENTTHSALEFQSVPLTQSAECEQQKTKVMEFLTTPDMDSHTSPATKPDPSVYFPFVHINRPICMLDTRGWECYKYCALVTILYFLWGFTYGILTSLTNASPNMANQSLSHVVSIVSVFYGAYLVGPLTVGQWVLRHHGFKATIITGLSVYCVGTLIYWPSGALGSYVSFIISNFVVGFGEGILKTASDTFLVLCGPPKYAESRLLIAGGVEIVAELCSGVISRHLFAVSVISTQWIYLGMTLVVVLISLIFYYMPLPEASDQELQSQTERIESQKAERLESHSSQKYSPGRSTTVLATFLFASFALFFVEGSTQCVEIFFAYLLAAVSKATSTSQTLSTNDYYLVGTAMFTVARFLFAFLCLFIPPRILLLVSYTFCIIFVTLMMSLSLPNVNSTAALGLMVVFFEAPLHPIGFAIGLRGLGKWTKLGGSILTAVLSSGCPFPFIQLAVAQAPERSVQYSFCVVIALFAAGALFALYLNLFPAVRHHVDPISLTSPRRCSSGECLEVDTGVAGGMLSQHNSSTFHGLP